MNAPTHADFIASIRADWARVSQIARTFPHDLRLPHLRRWRLHDVIAHLAGDHRWAYDIVSRRSATGTSLRKAPFRGEELCDYFDTISEQMIDALTNADLDAVCPSFAQGPTGSMRFWPRHQAHEAAIHRWDAESVTDAHTPFAPDLALDAIDELFEVYTARYGDQCLTQSIVLGCPEFATTWRVDPADRPGFVTITRSVASSAAPDFAATPESLLLALWHRIPADDPSLTYAGTGGDAARAFVSGPLVA